MLSWSAEQTGRTVDVRAVADPTVDPLVPGGRFLTAVARAGAGVETSPVPVAALGHEIGGAAAVDVAAVTAAFESFNRVVDGTGLPVGRARVQALADVIEELGLGGFPHADHL